MLVAVNHRIGCSAEQSALKHDPNSGKPKSAFGYGNPELNSRLFGFDKCVETIEVAPHVGEEIVQLSLKNEAELTYRHYDQHKLTIVPLGSNPHRIIGLTRRSLNPIGQGNPEPSREPFGFRACVEHIDPIPAFCG